MTRARHRLVLHAKIMRSMMTVMVMRRDNSFWKLVLVLDLTLACASISRSLVGEGVHVHTDLLPPGI